MSGCNRITVNACTFEIKLYARRSDTIPLVVFVVIGRSSRVAYTRMLVPTIVMHWLNCISKSRMPARCLHHPFRRRAHRFPSSRLHQLHFHALYSNLIFSSLAIVVRPYTLYTLCVLLLRMRDSVAEK